MFTRSDSYDSPGPPLLVGIYGNNIQPPPPVSSCEPGGCTEATVKYHVAHLLEKLGVGNRTEALSKALELGLIAKI